MNGIGTLTTAPNTPPGAKALGRIFGAISPKILYLAIYRPYRPPRGLFLFFHNTDIAWGEVAYYLAVHLDVAEELGSRLNLIRVLCDRSAERIS